MKRLTTILILIFVFGSLTACGVDEVIGGNDSIIFGTGTLDDGINEKRSTFTSDEDFLMEASLSEPFGASNITFIINQLSDDGTETIYDQWSDTVDPTWDYFLYEFHIVEIDGPFDQGEYVFKMFANESDLIADGTFTIE